MSAKKTCLTSMIVLTVLCSLASLAAAGDNPGPAAPEKPAVRGAGRAAIPEAALLRPALVKMFDADGSGDLDPEERAKARRAIHAKFDRNGDGVLDEKERAAMREWLAAERGQRAAKQTAREEPARTKTDPAADKKSQARPAQPGARAAGQHAPDALKVRNMVLRAYDADGDGILSPPEARRLRADLAPIMKQSAPPPEGSARPARRGVGAPDAPARPNRPEKPARPADSQARPPADT